MHIASVDKSQKKSDAQRKKRMPAKPFTGKGDPRNGRGPAKGAPNAGRPPNWWYAQMQEIRDRFLQAAVAQGVADDPDHPAWANVGKWAHEQLEGKAAQKVDVTSKGESLRPQRIVIGGVEIEF